MAKTKTKAKPRRKSPKNAGVSWSTNSPGLRAFLGLDDNGEQIVVNGKTFLQYPPIWYGVNKIAGHIGTTPLSAYEKVAPRERVERDEHPGSWTINHPNEFMDSMVFRETIQGHVLTWGNGRAAIERNGRNDPASLIPLLPDRTITVLVNGVKWHVTTDLETGEKTKFPDDDVLHVPGFSFDGINGYGLWEMFTQTAGIGLGAERQAYNHFKNDAVPPMVLEAPPGVFTKEADAKQFLKDWNEYHQGVNKSNRAGLLRNGVKANVLGANGQNSQWVEQRRFQRQDAALILLLEQILGDDSSVSYNSLEQKNLAYLSGCLNRWYIKWEEQCNRKLLTRDQYLSGRWYFKFNRNAILQTTAKERFDIYRTGREIGMYSPNDCRAFEDEPPRKDPEGDRYDNPNTTPGGPKKSAETQQEPPLDKPANDLATMVRISGASIQEYTLRAQVERLVESRTKELLTVERREVQEHVNAKSFMDWLDKFYSKSDFSRLVPRVVQELGGSKELAAAYLADSQQRLSDVAGANKQATFGDGLRAEIQGWDARADKLAADILAATAPMAYDNSPDDATVTLPEETKV